MTNRSAIDTIAGYFYQFDKTILAILNSSDDKTIIVEGIEDIDLISPDETTAVQCKYYEKTEYNHSVIKKPLILMLKNYADILKSSGKFIKYHLYGHYKSGQEKLSLPLTVDYVKENFFTYIKQENITEKGKTIKKKVTHRLDEELGLTNNNISDFINLLTINIEAPSFDNQFNDVIEKLCEYYQCDKFEAENFYYNSGLRVMKNLSIKQNIADRSINKSLFLTQIDTKQLLFNSWYVHYKGKTKYFKEVKKNYFNTGLNTNPYERFFLLEVKSTDSIQDIKDIIRLIQNRWSKFSKYERSSFCPYLYIHNISDANLKKVKQELFNEGMLLKDGYDFLDADFNVNSVLEKATFQNNIKIKFVNSIADLNTLLNQIVATKEIYQFFQRESFYSNNNCKHIIIQIEEIQDIKSIV